MREPAEPDGLCSHCSLIEGVTGDFSLSAEELEALATKREAIRAEKRAIISSNYHYRQMETNYDEYLDGMRERSRKRRTEKRKELREWERQNRANHVVKKTYHCNLCNTTCRSSSDLVEHERSDKHLQKVAWNR